MNVEGIIIQLRCFTFRLFNSLLFESYDLTPGTPTPNLVRVYSCLREVLNCGWLLQQVIGTKRKDKSRDRNPLFFQTKLQSNMFSLIYRQKGTLFDNFISNFRNSFSVNSRSGKIFREAFARRGEKPVWRTSLPFVT